MSKLFINCNILLVQYWLNFKISLVVFDFLIHDFLFLLFSFVISSLRNNDWLCDSYQKIYQSLIIIHHAYIYYTICVLCIRRACTKNYIKEVEIHFMQFTILQSKRKYYDIIKWVVCCTPTYYWQARLYFHTKSNVIFSLFFQFGDFVVTDHYLKVCVSLNFFAFVPFDKKFKIFLSHVICYVS